MREAFRMVDCCARAVQTRVVAAGEDGQDMVEYVLITALVSISALFVILLVGPYLQDLFRDIVNGINAS